MNLSCLDLDLIVFDFDGVLTNDYVYVDSNGLESVRCCRGDGLAFDALRKLDVMVAIISTEVNNVVTARAKKLQLPVFQGVKKKDLLLTKYVEELNFKLEKVLYVGNDVNDYRAMKICGFSICPSDSHKQIKLVADHVLLSCGGEGVVREIVEKIMGINLISVLFEE